MLGVEGGFTLIARNPLTTVAIVGVAWIVVRVVNRLIQRVFGVREDIRRRYPFVATRADRYLPIVRRGIVVLIQVAAALLVLQVWGLDIVAWLSSPVGRDVSARVLHIAMILGIAVLALELANGLVHLYLDVRENADEDEVPSQRLRTLQIGRAHV